MILHRGILKMKTQAVRIKATTERKRGMIVMMTTKVKNISSQDPLLLMMKIKRRSSK